MVGFASVCAADDAVRVADVGEIRSLLIDGDRAFYFEDESRQWYRADLRESCSALRFHEAVAMVSKPDADTGELSAIIAGGKLCSLQPFKKSDAPSNCASCRQMTCISSLHSHLWAICRLGKVDL